MTSQTEADAQEARRGIIWSTNAWVGANYYLSSEAKATVFWVALEDRLPGVTEAEVAHAIGIIEGAREAHARRG